ncbi:udp-glycosyltransferase 79b30 [Quercus suber]|uniref:Udp-glycosyltransferase 79b30 n=1 Tax=Quercus suber TaxID=58331 RepID=A0AAW0JIF3_QUESU
MPPAGAEQHTGNNSPEVDLMRPPSSFSVSSSIKLHCQLVLLPHVGDQILNARMMSNNLKVGVVVEKGEDGLFTMESVCKAVNKVMEVDSEVGREVRANHAKLRELLSSEDLESSYIDGFCQNLKDLRLLALSCVNCHSDCK